jgi:FeS assembly SUF system protein
MNDRANQRVALPLSGERGPSAPRLAGDSRSESPTVERGPSAPRLAGDSRSESPTMPVDPNASLEERVIAALHTVYDPEIPVDIYELGLIYELKVDPAGAVAIRMTLTSPMCPVAEALPAEVRSKVERVPGVASAKVDLVWEPPWDKSRMSEEAQLALGLFE